MTVVDVVNEEICLVAAAFTLNAVPMKSLGIAAKLPRVVPMVCKLAKPYRKLVTHHPKTPKLHTHGL
jgi:hypothetical protein